LPFRLLLKLGLRARTNQKLGRGEKALLHMGYCRALGPLHL